MKLSEAVKQFLAMSEVQHRSSTTRKYVRVLNAFAANTQELTLNNSPLLKYRENRLKAGLSRVTANGELALLRAFFVYCQCRGWVTGVIECRPLPVPLQRPGIIQAQEITALFAACANTKELLLLTVALKTGLRRQEIETLEWEDIYGGNIHVKAKPQWGFIPKNWKEREVPAPPEIERWRSQGLLFQTRFGRPQKHLCGQLLTIARRTGSSSITFRNWRHTFGTLIERASDVRTTQHLLGHASIQTTMKYLAPRKDVAAITEKAFKEISVHLEN